MSKKSQYANETQQNQEQMKKAQMEKAKQFFEKNGRSPGKRDEISAWTSSSEALFTKKWTTSSSQSLKTTKKWDTISCQLADKLVQSKQVSEQISDARLVDMIEQLTKKPDSGKITVA